MAYFFGSHCCCFFVEQVNHYILTLVVHATKLDGHLRAHVPEAKLAPGINVGGPISREPIGLAWGVKLVFLKETLRLFIVAFWQVELSHIYDDHAATCTYIYITLPAYRRHIHICKHICIS